MRKPLPPSPTAPTTEELLGNSPALRQLRETIVRVAAAEVTVLINGESGTGKEVVAQSIHRQSARATKPFLAVNCTAISDNLLESDLFGYEKGAFTGAGELTLGKFEIVDGGTLFLDEIGDISSRTQAALLRVLQNGEIIRVGGNQTRRVDVRIIAATNVDLLQAVKNGKFRLDLYYRLNIVTLLTPPLRERREDIDLLANHFFSRYCQLRGKELAPLSEPVLAHLRQHDWPGNVRELDNLIQRVVLMATTATIGEAELGLHAAPRKEPQAEYPSVPLGHELFTLSFKEETENFEKNLLARHLQQSNWDVLRTAKKLQLSKTSLYNKIKRYGLSAS